MVSKIRKRNNVVVAFDCDKIESAIKKAVKSVGGTDTEHAKALTDEVLRELDEVYGPYGIPEVEEVQNLVEKVLIKQGHDQVAKAYIIYRSKRKQLREMNGLFETLHQMNGEIKIDEDGQNSFSLQGLNNYISENVLKNYWLQKLYSKKVKELHETGLMHIHDLGTVGLHATGWDLQDLIHIGIRGKDGNSESKPAKHLRSALDHITNFFEMMIDETNAHQTIPHFDTLLAPFVRYDNLSYSEVKQCVQEFIFNLSLKANYSLRNKKRIIGLDLIPSKELKETHIILEGQIQKERYSDFKSEMKWINKALAECFMEGDASYNPFSHPTLVYHISKDFNWETDAPEELWDLTARYGSSIFVSDTISPLTKKQTYENNISQLKQRGKASEQSIKNTGSIGKVTINLAMIGNNSTSKEDFLRQLTYVLEGAKESLEIKRKTLEQFTHHGFYSHAQFYLRKAFHEHHFYWKEHVSSIGILRLHEAALNILSEDSSSEEIENTKKEILKSINDILLEFQDETKNYYSLEGTTSPEVIKRFTVINNQDITISPNSSLEELNKDTEELYSHMTGSIEQVIQVEEITKQDAKKMIQEYLKKSSSQGIRIEPLFTICNLHGYVSGKHDTCPRCEDEEEAFVVTESIEHDFLKENIEQGTYSIYDLQKTYEATLQKEISLNNQENS